MDSDPCSELHPLPSLGNSAVPDFQHCELIGTIITVGNLLYPTMLAAMCLMWPGGVGQGSMQHDGILEVP